MRVLSLIRPGEFGEVDIAEPGAPAEGEVLVRIHRVGICGTDLHAFQGRQTFFTYPRILGHELGVEVVAVGPGVQGVSAGQRGVLEPYLHCGACPACRAGKTNCCQSLRVLGVHIDGGMRHYLSVPAEKLHRSAKLSLDMLAAVEPLCIGSHAFARPLLKGGESIAVLGAGPIGLAVIEAARAAGFEPLVVEISPRRIEYARARMHLGVIDAAGDPAASLRDALAGDLPRCIFDCTGNRASMERAFDLVGHGGQIVFVGHYPGELTYQVPTFHGKEVTLYGSRNSTGDDFRRVIGHLESGRLDIAHWLAPAVRPEQMADQFPVWMNPDSGIIKPIIALT